MKILNIIPSLDPKGGGPVEGIKQLSRYDAELGITREVCCLDDPSTDFSHMHNITVHALGSGIGSYGYNRQLIPWLKKNRTNYDAVIVNGIWQYTSFAAWCALRHTSTPYYVYTHGMLDPWFKHTYPLKHLKKCLYWPWAEYRVLRDAAKVLFTCEEEKVLATQSFWPNRWNGHVVNYGTSGHLGDLNLQREQFLEQFPHLKNKRCLLFLSRIHPKKGIDLLIESFAKIVSSYSDLHLIIAGPDQVGWQKKLMQIAEERNISQHITWTGMLTGDLKWGAYHSAEAFILPSHQENFGIVVAESLSCSLPVLISNKVNIWREIEQDNGGIIANDDLDGCIKLIENWLKIDEFTKNNMKVNARQCFLNRFEARNAAISLLKAIS